MSSTEARLGIKTARLGSDPKLASLIVEGLEHWKQRGADLPPIVRVKKLKPGVIAHLWAKREPSLEVSCTATPYFSAAKFASEGFVSTGKNGLLLHEIGHYRHLCRCGIDEYLDICLTRFTWNQYNTAQRVSDAAVVDPGEFVAETFAGLSTGRNYARSILAMYAKFQGPTAL